MSELLYSLKEFKAALENKEAVYLRPQGEWTSFRFLSPYFFIKRTTQSFILFLDGLEKELDFPVLEVLAAGEALPSDITLQQRLVALKYRTEQIKPEAVEANNLEAQAFAWKESKKLFWNPALSPWDLKELKKTASYKAFLPLLENPPFREKFFEWTIRDRLPADVYIEFPAMAEKINKHLLNGRIGTLGGDKLKIQKWGKKKVVTLPFEGKEMNILDGRQKIHFRGGFTLTLDEIFKLFADKPRKFVDVEYFAHGIANWNAQHLGYFLPKQKRYETINIDQPEWWKQLPPLEIISQEEAKERYGSFVNGINWVVVAKASRQYLNLNYEKCHAYLEIAIPSSDGSYYIYDFGKFARYFPYGVVDNMRMFTITTPATIAYPDENIYHTARQHVGYAFELNHYQGLLLMEEIRQDIIHARAGNMVFQIEAENCGHWIQTHLEELLGKENVPNLFRAKLLKSDAQGFIGAYFKLVRMLPDIYQSRAMNIFHYPFGAWRGQYVVDRTGERVFKSLNRTSFWKDIIVYMPALLHEQFERGYISPNDKKAS